MKWSRSLLIQAKLGSKSPLYHLTWTHKHLRSIKGTASASKHSRFEKTTVIWEQVDSKYSFCVKKWVGQILLNKNILKLP